MDYNSNQIVHQKSVDQTESIKKYEQEEDSIDSRIYGAQLQSNNSKLKFRPKYREQNKY